MTIEEGNSIIAIYDGWQWESEEWDMMYKIQEGFWYSENELHEDITLDEARYHNDWNWLIPVVKKVMKELWDMKIPHPDSIVCNDLRNAVGRLDIEQIWQWTIEGIKIINKYADNRTK